jgi:hypothetical protein
MRDDFHTAMVRGCMLYQTGYQQWLLLHQTQKTHLGLSVPVVSTVGHELSAAYGAIVPRELQSRRIRLLTCRQVSKRRIAVFGLQRTSKKIKSLGENRVAIAFCFGVKRELLC